MTRVYAVAAWLGGNGPSGAQQRLTALLRALPDLLADDERVVVLYASDPPVRPGRHLALQHVSIPSTPTWRRALAERRVLPRLLLDLRANLLHLESLPVPPVPSPVALTVHDLRDLGPFRRRSRWLFSRTLRHGVARARTLIAPSMFSARALTAATGATAVTVVPGAIDPQWRAGPLRAVPWSGAFLHVGHLEPRKDLDTLLAAYGRAQARTALPPLVLAGRDAGCASRLRQRARRAGIADRVIFAGAVDDATLRGLYAGARAVLVPSRYEGFGLPALEGLAFGRAVVVSDSGALPEVVGDAGLIVPAGDIAAWAHALQTLATQDDPVGAVAARQARAATFAVTAAARTLLGVWRRAAGGDQHGERLRS